MSDSEYCSFSTESQDTVSVKGYVPTACERYKSGLCSSVTSGYFKKYELNHCILYFYDLGDFLRVVGIDRDDDMKNFQKYFHKEDDQGLLDDLIQQQLEESVSRGAW